MVIDLQRIGRELYSILTRFKKVKLEEANAVLSFIWIVYHF
jgi:hypothetical protein